MVDSALTIAFLVRDQSLRDACRLWLRDRAVTLQPLDLAADPVPQLEQLRDSFDALLLERGLLDPASTQALREAGLVFPAVVIGEVSGAIDYHTSEVHLPPDQLEQLRYSIDAAISGFLRQGLQESSRSAPSGSAAEEETADRWKLANRLRERLGYLGVFYKRDPARFLRNLPESDREQLTRSLERTYRDLLLSYFKNPAAANQALESFVNTAFFCDLTVTKTVEIHINLIDRFAKQLKMEGHKSDFLQDYRLALIDVMAHLCEMYRRSVPADPPIAVVSASVDESALSLSTRRFDS
ncbi:MAG: circadian clock protein KaiA [Cyanobacteriota bacterium]|nr:circadian clock protein KaiA [Cyanobacteriota bacterium]